MLPLILAVTALAFDIPAYEPGQRVYVEPVTYAFATHQVSEAVGEVERPVYVVILEAVVDGTIESGHESETEDAIEAVWKEWLLAPRDVEGAFDPVEGSLILLAMDEREVRIRTGSRWDSEYGLHNEALLPIIDIHFMPRAVAQDLDGGLAQLARGLDAAYTTAIFDAIVAEEREIEADRVRAERAEARRVAELRRVTERELAEREVRMKRARTKRIAMWVLPPAFGFALLFLVGFLLHGRRVVARVAREDLAGHVHLLGPREDTAPLLAALDVLVSASRSEGFPNVLGEALACGTPCVATDVGESRIILEGVGAIVPPNDAAALAEGLLTLLNEDPAAREERSRRGRERVAECYALPVIARLHEDLYANL